MWREHDEQARFVRVAQRTVGGTPVGKDRFDTIEYRLAAHQHPRAAAERAIVDLLMLVGAIVPDIPQPDVDQPALDGQLEQALLQVAVEDAGKEGEYVETHVPVVHTDASDESRMTHVE